MSQTHEFDYVIVGSGTAGCVLANRLSADPSIKVVMLESGPPDDSWTMKVPAAVAAAIGDPRLGWGYFSVPQANLNGRKVAIPRGRVLGGCSSINGMAYFRGHPQDFDDWAAAGARGWSYREVLPYFKLSENNEAWPDSPLHGNGGPMNVIDIPKNNPLVDRFLQATDSLGYPRCRDFSSLKPEGFGPRQATIRNGRRESGVTAYINPVRSRPNLSIVTGCHVERVLLEGKRAVGVRADQLGQTVEYKARREVIMAAGAYGSPQLLMLSGIGPGEDLQALGIQVVHDMKGVGLGLHDHPAAAIGYVTKDPSSYGVSLKAFPRGAWNVLEYLLWRRGPLAGNVLEATGFIRSSEAETRPDLQLVFMPVHRNPSGSPLPIGHGYGMISILARPQSRGTVRLASDNSHDAPLIDPNFLAVSQDLEKLLYGIKLTRSILNTPAFAPLASREVIPGDGTQSDDDWREHIRRSLVTVHHPCSTCRMGEDDKAVVDSELRVRGMEGLRVVDASVFPQVVAGNSNAGVVMVAEKASDLILDKRPLPPLDLPPA
ncbi:MAG: GMC family oxidoreductase N-terminal domain-containing protein [Gammaproteobacteria bacterium]|nr:GMC family oxidoreductase N-terminal domain-containing protein [Gammaproteobacteria bacterium]